MTDTDKTTPPRDGEILAWHFVGAALRDGRSIPPDGKWLVHRGAVVPCKSGLHASVRLIDALQYAPGDTVCRVVLRGEIAHHGNDKIVARRRKILWRYDAEQLLGAFARQCALDVARLWDMPPVVRQYLETGDETLKDAAWDAAWAAARAAAKDAARDAASAATWAAAWAAARAAAKDAAWAAAKDAARAAAKDAASGKFNDRLEAMVAEASGQSLKARMDRARAAEAALEKAREALTALRKLLPHEDLGAVGLFTYGPFAVEAVASSAEVKEARAALAAMEARDE